VYAARRRRVDAAPAMHSRYPVDATGWLLLELLRGVLLRACGRIVRLERWPAPYSAAAAVTHDIEPRRYAYTTGLPRLLSRSQGASPRPTFGLVADAARRHLRPETRRRLRRADVLCHGLTHRDEPRRGRAAIAAQLRTARATLEGRLRRRVDGYRSPRLDRSPDLLWALDRTGFRYDSSYPDVDRENLGHFGSGVRFNLPYRPLLADDGWRTSACLEVPLTAPDCIQPLFTGDSDDDLRTAVSLKAAFVRRSGGLYCALVHAGVFGDRDADRRERHLEYVLQRLRHADTWLASLGEIVDWWCQREALRVTVDGERVAVTNVGPQPIAGVRVVLDGRRGERRRLLPPLTAGQRVLVDFAPDALALHRAQPA
jgi:peptidoglycan/xylan/chitin deacetylase (PgdA/CDA1 family)